MNCTEAMHAHRKPRRLQNNSNGMSILELRPIVDISCGYTHPVNNSLEATYSQDRGGGGTPSVDEENMTQPKLRISTTNAPAAIGPYSQAVRVGDLIFTSGQIGLDPATGAIVSGGIREQTTRVLDNLAAVLREAGLDMADVIKTTVYLQDMSDFAAMNDIYATYIAPEGVVPPARSTVEVARLPKDALVEIDLIARKP